jgi:hypothetical protein
MVPVFRLTLALALFVGVAVGSGRPLVAQEHLLINTDAVHQVLGLTPEQIDKVKALFQEFAMAEQKAAMQITKGVAFGSLSTQKQSELRPQIIEAVVALDESFRMQLAEILTADQMNRLRQLRYQALGPAVILNEQFSKELAITPEQREQFKAALTEYRTKYIEENQATLSKLAPAWAGGKLRDAVTSWLVAQLTEEQQAKYRELVGEPAELPVFKTLR